MSSSQASAQFAIELEASGLTGPAKDAASALEALKGKLEGDVAALRQMQAAMRNLKAGTNVSKEAVQQLSGQIAAQKAKISASQASYLKLGGTFGSIKRPAEDATSKLAAFFERLKTGSPAIRNASTSITQLIATLGAVGVAGAAALAVVAIAALSAGVIAGTMALLNYGLAASDARRAELLHLEGLTKITNWYGIAAGKASDLQDAIDNVSGASALGRPQIAGYAEQLYRMGLRGKNLSEALEATAIKASTQGEQWASMFMGQAAGAAAVGQSVHRLADTVKARLGGIAQRQAMGFGVQITKLRENIARIFSGLKIEGFLSAMFEVLQIFNQASAGGQALKAILETAFNPLFGGIEGGRAIVRRFIKGAVIGALDVAIAFMKTRNLIADTFGAPEFLKGVDVTKVALISGKLAVYAFAAAIGAIAIAFTITAAATAVFVASIAGVVGAVGLLVFGVVAAGKAVWDALSGAYARVQSLPWNELGVNIVKGISSGILSSTGLTTAAITSLASLMKATFANVMGIHSPSLVFKGYGQNIGRGVVGGVNAEKPAVARSVSAMVEIPTLKMPEFSVSPVIQESQAPAIQRAPEAPTETRQVNQSSPSISVSIDQLHVHASEGSPRGFAEQVRQEIYSVLEGAAIHMGALPSAELA